MKAVRAVVATSPNSAKPDQSILQRLGRWRALGVERGEQEGERLVEAGCGRLAARQRLPLARR